LRIVVQKFGGTSVSSEELQLKVIDRVRDALDRGVRPVVVVSAMGRSGDPYATDTLLDLARQPGLESSPRDLDLMMSCGEIISATNLASRMRKRGLASRVFTGAQAGIVTDHNYGKARIIRIESDGILKSVGEGVIPVVCGFQGTTETGDVTTLGRGGSDTTAAALGAALKAEHIEIFTDVDGIKTADPIIVPEARTLASITYHEISQMAHEGAKVVHPRAVDIARAKNIPVWIKPLSSDLPGTVITSMEPIEGRWTELPREKLITGVTHLQSIAQVVVHGDDGKDEVGLPVFQRLAEADISVDLINVSPEQKSFTISVDDLPRTKSILGALGVRFSVRERVAKVSIVGVGMRGVPGVMASVVKALDDEDIQILQTADSHMTISCLVHDSDTGNAVRALHRQFGLGKGTGERGGLQ